MTTQYVVDPWRRAARRAGLGRFLLRYVIAPAQRCWRLRLPDRNCRVVIRGLTLEILNPRRNRVGEALYCDGVWEPEVTDVIRTLVRPGMTAIDIGADIGYYTVIMSAQAAHGRIVAFEPLPVARQVLERNVRANDLHNVHVCDCALGREGGSGWITKPLELSRLDPTGSGAGADDVAVKIRRFDDVAKALGLTQVDFMKIDVEGAEHEVLRGCVETLDRDRPTVLVEVHGGLLPLFQTSIPHLFSWMGARGYGYRPIDGDPGNVSTTSTVLFEPVK